MFDVITREHCEIDQTLVPSLLSPSTDMWSCCCWASVFRPPPRFARDPPAFAVDMGGSAAFVVVAGEVSAAALFPWVGRSDTIDAERVRFEELLEATRVNHPITR